MKLKKMIAVGLMAVMPLTISACAADEDSDGATTDEEVEQMEDTADTMAEEVEETADSMAEEVEEGVTDTTQSG